MKKPHIPASEEKRLEQLDATNLVYSPDEERFDRITKIAKALFDVPITVISLVTESTQWFKSTQGLDNKETTREISFCGHAILKNAPMIINDTLRDPRFADNPLVTGEPHIRFYAGQPVQFNGKNVGVMCVIDNKPRQFTGADIEMLKNLAAMVESEFNMTMLNTSQQEMLNQRGQEGRRDMVDQDTNTWNRAGFKELLHIEVERAVSKQELFTFMRIKLLNYDQITAFQDAEAERKVIREIAVRIRNSLRPYDLIGSTGDGDFCAFISNCDEHLSELLLSRIQARITESKISAGGCDFEARLRIGICTLVAKSDIDLEEVENLALKDLDLSG